MPHVTAEELTTPDSLKMDRELFDDVPIEAVSLEIKLQMAGAGTLWADDFVFEKVNSSVPLAPSYGPQNLNFIEPTNTTKEKHK